MNSDARFWDKRAEKYTQRPVANQVTYEKKLEIMFNSKPGVVSIDLIMLFSRAVTQHFFWTMPVRRMGRASLQIELLGPASYKYKR